MAEAGVSVLLEEYEKRLRENRAGVLAGFCERGMMDFGGAMGASKDESGEIWIDASCEMLSLTDVCVVACVDVSWLSSENIVNGFFVCLHGDQLPTSGRCCKASSIESSDNK